MNLKVGDTIQVTGGEFFGATIDPDEIYTVEAVDESNLVVSPGFGQLNRWYLSTKKTHYVTVSVESWWL